MKVGQTKYKEVLGYVEHMKKQWSILMSEDL